jgi:hypothetical protein
MQVSVVVHKSRGGDRPLNSPFDTYTIDAEVTIEQGQPQAAAQARRIEPNEAGRVAGK